MEPLHCLEMSDIGHQSRDNAAPHPRHIENVSCAVILTISVKVYFFFFFCQKLQAYAWYLSSFHVAFVWVMKLRNEEDGSVFVYILFVTSMLHFRVLNNCAYCWLRKVVEFFRWMRCTGKRQSSTACSITSSSLASWSTERRTRMTSDNCVPHMAICKMCLISNTIPTDIFCLLSPAFPLFFTLELNTDKFTYIHTEMFYVEHKALCVWQRTMLMYLYCTYIKILQIKCIIN